VSFFDIFTTTERYTYSDPRTSGDTWNYGWFVFAYTAQFGNGFSATISAEAPRRLGVVDGAGGGFNANAVTATDTAGFSMPDVVGNLRIDQNWGYAGISGAVHKVAGGYFGGGASTSFNVNTSHPDDKYGWAVGVGGMVNLPWIGPGDSIGANFVYTRGAVAYATKGGNWQIEHGNSIGVGWITDGMFDNNIPNLGAGQVPIQLTNAWSLNAAFEHFWNPRWRTSLYGGYTRVWYNQDATNIANQHLPTPPTAPGIACGVAVEGAVWPVLPINHGEGNSCSPNFSFYQIGSRTQWNVTSNFYMGIDVTYTHLNTAWQGPAVPNSVVPSFIDDQNVWSGIFRMQHSFVPGNEGPTVIFGR
jgi:porin-like protein